METNRIEEINNFLNVLGKIYSQNKGLDINHCTIYSLLSKYDYEEKEIEDLNTDKENLFDKWITIIKKDVKETNVVCINNILYITNTNELNKDGIKIILSFDKSQIFKCVNKIIEYIGNRKIKFECKIFDTVRSDNVIIRVFKKEDAIRILDYINNDNELSLSANLTNPFMLREGVTAVTYDNSLSYNKVLSYLLSCYIQDKKDKKALSKVSVNDFLKYVKSMYEDIFVKNKCTKDFLESKTYQNERNLFEDDFSALCEYMDMFEVIINQLNNNFSIENLFKLFNDFNSKNHIQSKREKISKIIKNQGIEFSDDITIKQKNLIDEYIKYANTKYGLTGTIVYLNNYVDKGVLSITRENNFRELFRNYVTEEAFNIIVNNIENYVEDILHVNNTKLEYEKENDEQIQINNSLDNSIVNNTKEVIPTSENEIATKIINKREKPEFYNLFLDACQATYDKYGEEQLKKAIYNATTNNIYSYFTNNDESYRDKLIDYVTTDMMKKFIKIFMEENGLDSHTSTLSTFCNLFKKRKKKKSF